MNKITFRAETIGEGFNNLLVQDGKSATLRMLTGVLVFECWKARNYVEIFIKIILVEANDIDTFHIRGVKKGLVISES